MKKTIYLIFSLVLILGIASCQSEKETEVIDTTESADPICTYSYAEESTEFEWTAYKTSEKKGVPGTFNDIDVTSIGSTDPKEVLESITFVMQTASVETNVEDRNLKIAEHFFKTIHTEVIEGSINSLGDDGKAVLTISMNGIMIDIEGEYTLEEGDFSFNSVIDVSAWSALAGIEALNAVCEDLHKGEDGVSK